MIQAVKIKHKETGMFRNKQGEFTSSGRTYTKLGHAKTSLLSSISDKRIYHCDFICLYDGREAEKIPVASYIIDYLSRKVKTGQYGYEANQKKIAEIIRYCRDNGLEYEYNNIKDTNNKGELKECPMCGSKAKLNKQRVTVFNADGYTQYQVECINNCIATMFNKDKELVINTWNRRC